MTYRLEKIFSIKLFSSLRNISLEEIATVTTAVAVIYKRKKREKNNKA